MDAHPLPESITNNNNHHHQQRYGINDNAILQNISPERTNRQPMLPPPNPSSIPSSPTPSVGSPYKAHLFQDQFLSSRRGSDVQGKVTQFNNLSRSNSERRQDLEKALQRARLGREEAESENEVLRGRMEDFVERERKVGLRLEEGMEENEKLRLDLRRFREKYDRAKDALTHSKERFREELKRMKAAEFKADSNQLAAQQALQSERQVIRFLEMDLKQSRDKTDRMEKESFTTQIKLIEFDEELVKVQQQLKLVEEERDAIKTSLKEEEVARIAAEGRIPLPISSVADEFSSPKKNRDSHIPTPKGKRLSRPALNDVFEFDIKKHADEMVYLRRQLEIETLSRKSAEDLAEFMQLSCQFKSCSCRFAEEKGVEFVYDDRVYNQELQDQYEEIQRMLKADAARRQDSAREIAIAQPTKSLIDLEDEIEFSPETGTFHTAKSPKRPTASESIQPPALKPCDDHSPNTTIVTTLAPAFEEESPSISVFSETPEILHKGSTDEYQILPVGHFEQSIERVEEQDPTTPKVIRYRESDADLLSFTPFVLPSLGSQPDQALANDVTESFVLTVNALSNSSRPVQPREQSYLTQHSSSYPPPKHTLPHHQNFNRRRSQSSQSSHSTHQTIITYTTTTTIPLAPEPKTPPSNHLPKSISKSTSAPTSLVSEVESTPGQGTDSRSGLALGYSPGTTKSREEALACIRSWRRGNAEAAGGAVTGTGPTTTTTGKEGVNARSGWSDHGGINGKPRSRSVVLVATPGQRRLGGGVGLGGGGRDRQGERERDISAPVRL